jgi:RNA polymerase sigma factor (sigma-70 family)
MVKSMLDDIELLRRYAQRQDESAFSALVARHLNLVYSAAHRQLDGDPHLAEDVAQAVFTDLARKAASLVVAVAGGKPLTGWLYTSTRFAASRVRRSEQRRAVRELAAHAMNADHDCTPNGPDPNWADLGPLLDEAMSQLPQVDRDAVLLRFFEGKDLRSVGAALGLSEDAARKRVSRALDHLRGVLTARGVTTTIAALAATLPTQAVRIAPAGLAAKVARTSLTSATATSTTSTLSSILLMTTQFKIIVATAAALLLAGSIIHHASRSNRNVATPLLPVSTPVALVNKPAAPFRGALSDAHVRPGPIQEATDPAIAAALAKIRAALAAPGKIEIYPQPEMKKAISELRDHYREALPILREALHHPDWEVRRRAAGGLSFLSIAASDAVPDLIAMLREAPTVQDAIQAAAALRSIGVKADSLPDLRDALAGKPDREIIEAHFPGFVEEAAQQALGATDGSLLRNAVANLTADGEDARLSGLLAIAGLGPAAFDTIPALKDFISQPNREDLKLYAEKLLAEIDPDFRTGREDPAFQEQQAARARAFSEKARSGQATVGELITAMRELPQAIPAAAQALGAIGFDELDRRGRENPQSRQEMFDAIVMLNQIAASNKPLEARLAASEAFAQLQPMQGKLLYTADEATPAFAVITNALSRLSGDTRLQVEAPFGLMLDQARSLWTVLQRSGDVTDYQSSMLKSYARGLAQTDQRTYDEFVAAMRKADPNFLLPRP